MSQQNTPPFNRLLTVGPDDYARLQFALAAIRTVMPMWQIRDYAIERIKGHGHLNPVTIIRNAFAKCPDEGAMESTSDLAFISDEELRDGLRVDISSANQAFQNGE